MDFMINMMSFLQHLREQNNFNSYLAILSAIESAAVSRLDWSERIIKVRYKPRLSLVVLPEYFLEHVHVKSG